MSKIHVKLSGRPLTICGKIPKSLIRFVVADWLRAFLMTDCKNCANILYKNRPIKKLEITK